MIRQILSHLKIQEENFQVIGETWVSKIPPSVKSIDIAGVVVPLYGELLQGEVVLKSNITLALLPYLQKISKLYSSLGNPQCDLESLTSQLKLGSLLIKTTQEIQVDFSELGGVELKQLAERAKVSSFVNIEQEIDGVTDNSLIEIIIKNFDSWVNNGVQGSNSLEMANFVLLDQPVLQITGQKVVEVDGGKTLSELGLSWDDLYVFKDVESPLFIPALLIFFRTGCDQNILNYVTQSAANEFIKQLLEEAKEIVESIELNKNVDTETNQSGEEKKPLEPTTSSLPAAKVKEKVAKVKN